MGFCLVGIYRGTIEGSEYQRQCRIFFNRSNTKDQFIVRVFHENYNKAHSHPIDLYTTVGPQAIPGRVPTYNSAHSWQL